MLVIAIVPIQFLPVYCEIFQSSIKGTLFKRLEKAKVDPDAAKSPISIRLDGAVLADLRSEAERFGIPYQTLISSVLHRYITGELVDPKAINLSRIVAKAS
jgi:predicted DNA binding CopG/RHH family protein